MNDLAQQIIGGAVRSLVAMAAGYMAAKGIALTGSQTDTIIGALMILGTVGWSGLQKVWASSASRSIAVASAVASVEHGVPVTVTVTPEGQPNVATRVSGAEAAAAPAVPIDVPPTPAPAAA